MQARALAPERRSPRCREERGKQRTDAAKEASQKLSLASKGFRFLSLSSALCVALVGLDGWCSKVVCYRESTRESPFLLEQTQPQQNRITENRPDLQQARFVSDTARRTHGTPR